RVEPGRHQDQRRFRQVVEEGGRGFEEQGKVVLDAAMRDTLGNLAVDAGLRGLALEARAVVATEACNVLLVQRDLPGGQDPYLGGRLRGELRFRIEIPQRFHVVVEKIDPHRRLRSHREDIEQGAAHCNLAMLRYLWHAQVAAGRQAIEELLAVEFLSL